MGSQREAARHKQRPRRHLAVSQAILEARARQVTIQRGERNALGDFRLRATSVWPCQRSPHSTATQCQPGPRTRNTESGAASLLWDRDPDEGLCWVALTRTWWRGAWPPSGTARVLPVGETRRPGPFPCPAWRTMSPNSRVGEFVYFSGHPCTLILKPPA